MPRNLLASWIVFSRRWTLLPRREIYTCAMLHYSQAKVTKEATGNQTMLGFEPLTRCCYSNSESKKDVVPSFPHVPKLGTSICFPYPARQVSNSWRTQDGFFLLKRKRKVTWCFSSHKQWIPVKTCFLSTCYPEWLNQHMTSVFDECKDWVIIVLDFRTNNNIKYVKINFTLPVMIDAKSAKFCEPCWKSGHNISST